MVESSVGKRPEPDPIGLRRRNRTTLEGEPRRADEDSYVGSALRDLRVEDEDIVAGNPLPKLRVDEDEKLPNRRSDRKADDDVHLIFAVRTVEPYVILRRASLGASDPIEVPMNG